MSQLGRVALPSFRTAIPALEIREGRYLARFARTPDELYAALRLRFEGFNLELGVGATSSFQTGRDALDMNIGPISYGFQISAEKRRGAISCVVP